MKEVYFTTIISFSFFILGHSQSLDDAVRYSLLNSSSTARSIGVGGSMSPLGADISVANTNPAGIAEFKKSEFVLGLGLPTNSTDATIGLADQQNEKTSRLTLNTLGVVFAYRPNAPKMRNINMSFGVNQLAHFNQTLFYSGATPGTRVERFLEVSNLRTLDELDPFEGGLAYDTELISDQNQDFFYESDFRTFEEEVYKEEFIERSGSYNELFMNFAANYDNKISFGLTLGIPIINYSETKNYLEADDFEIIPNFLDYIFTQNLSTTGGGINIKLGAIYKITPKVRISGAIHSPSWLFLTDEFSTGLDFRVEGEEIGIARESPLSEFEYRLQTPWRAFGGVGMIYSLGDIKGFINGEVEYVDYSNANFDVTINSNDPIDQFFEEDLNNEIDQSLTNAINIRLGTELAYKKYRLRVGAAQMGSPYANTNLLDLDPQLSAGIGWRGSKIYFDLAYSTQSQDREYTPYRLLDASFNQTVNTKSNRNLISLTFGIKI